MNFTLASGAEQNWAALGYKRNFRWNTKYLVVFKRILHMIRYFFGALLFTFLALFPSWATAGTTAVTISRVGQDFYRVAGSNALLQTKYCYKFGSSMQAQLTMTASLGVQDGQIDFGGGTTCIVAGAYATATVPAGTYPATLTYLSQSFFIDSLKKILYQTDALCMAIYTGSATFSLNSYAQTYQGGMTIGTMQFPSYIYPSSCSLAGVYFLANLTGSTTPSVPILSNFVLDQVMPAGALVSATSSLPTTGYWVVLPASAAAPTPMQIVAGQDASGKTSAFRGSAAMAAGVITHFTLSGLASSTAYVAYFAGKDSSNQISSGTRLSFTTAKALVPSFKVLDLNVDTIRGTNAVLSLKVDKASDAHWLVLPASATIPSLTQVMVGADASWNLSPLKGYGPLKANVDQRFVLSGLQPGTAYNVFAMASTAEEFSTGLYASFSTLSADTAVTPVAPETGWWWNPSEGGRGYSLELNANGNIFFAGFMYDSAGSPVWYVSTLNRDAVTGFYRGDLQYFQGGQTLTGRWKLAGAPARSGTVTLMPTATRQATLKLEPEGLLPQVTNIERFPIIDDGITQPPVAGNPQTGWWWNPDEGGRGYFIEVQGGTAFIAAYMYADNGKPIWYVTQNTLAISSYQGALTQYGNGQTLGGLYKSPVVSNASVGTAVLQFSSPTKGTLILPGGITVPLQRFVF